MFPQGISGVLRASGMVFFSYVGFDSVSTLAEVCVYYSIFIYKETKNPKRDMVIGILGTLGIATTLYIAVSLVLTGMVPFTALDEQSPLSEAFKDHNQNIIALTTTTATTLTCLLGQPRIFYRMAHDGLFFKLFENITYGTCISGIVAALIGTFINFNLLAEMISVGTLSAYILVCAGVIIMRYEDTINNYKYYGRKQNDELNVYKYDNMFTNNLPSLMAIYAILCVCFAFAIDITQGQKQYWIVLIVIGVLMLASLGCIVYIDQILKNAENVMKYVKHDNDDKIFLCPYIPYLPCLGIFVNSYMIASLKWESFARVIVWFVIGLILYIFMGVKIQN
eukprot:87377_1